MHCMKLVILLFHEVNSSTVNNKLALPLTFEITPKNKVISSLDGKMEIDLKEEQQQERKEEETIKQIVHGRVSDFTAPDQICYVPNWVFIQDLYSNW